MNRVVKFCVGGIKGLLILLMLGLLVIAVSSIAVLVITTGDHAHLAPRIVEPIAGTFQIDMLVTSLDYPALQRIELHRNGSVLSEPDDYTLDLPTGLVTLVIPSAAGERFTAFREVQF